MLSYSLNKNCLHHFLYHIIVLDRPISLFWQKTYWQGIGWHFIKYHWELYLVYEQWESIRHVNNITTMQFFWNSQPHSVKSWPYHRLILLSHGNLMHYGNVINMLYCASAWLESEMSTLDLSNVKNMEIQNLKLFFWYLYQELRYSCALISGHYWKLNRSYLCNYDV